MDLTVVSCRGNMAQGTGGRDRCRSTAAIQGFISMRAADRELRDNNVIGRGNIWKRSGQEADSRRLDLGAAPGYWAWFRSREHQPSHRPGPKSL